MNNDYHHWRNLYKKISTMSEEKSKRKAKKKGRITRSSSGKNEVSSGATNSPETETPEKENLIMVGGIAGFCESNNRLQTFSEFTRKIQALVNTKSTS